MRADRDRTGAEFTRVLICQGFPICELEGDEAVAAQQSGCVWCTKHYIFDDGREETEEVHST